MNKDLTVGRPETVLRQFCLPLFGSVLFQQLYNIADSLVAGNFVGENALAAVGNSYEITLIFLAFAFGCNIGCSVVVSKLFGAKEYGRLKTAVYTALISCAVLCAVLMSVGILFADTLLSCIHTPKNIFSDSALYLKIYIYSIPFVFFYNLCTGIFSALGDSRTPFYFLMFSSLSNIGMDILFVTKLSAMFPRGVDGVAWATFLCQGVSCVLAVVCIFLRLHAIHTAEKISLFSRTLLVDIAKVAVPSVLQQSFVSVGNILIQSVINGFGSGVIAGYAAAVKLNNLVITSLNTIGNGISNFTAQNIGAQKSDRVKNGFRAGYKFDLALCLPITALYLLGGKLLLRIFMENPTGEAMTVGITFLRILAPFYGIIALKIVSDGILRGAGKMNQFMIATFTDLILRVVLAKILSVPFGSTGIWMAWPVGWLISTAMSYIFYVKSIRNRA